MINKDSKLCIFCSNIHSGGGLQVAVSFVSSLLNTNCKHVIDIYVSSEIFNQLPTSVFPENLNIIKKNVYGYKSIIFSSFLSFKYDRIFTLFGPRYSFTKCKFESVGFAQSWILCNDNNLFRLSYKRFWLLYKLKFTFQFLFFLRSDVIVSEIEYVSDLLGENIFLRNKLILTVHNAISNVYEDKNQWSKDVFYEKENNTIYLGYLARPYPHKNIDILSDVFHLLNTQGSKKYKLVLTLTDNEFSKLSDNLVKYVINIGPLNISQCPPFYNNIDGFVFPSLLESFSVSPLEALYMKVPLFASNRNFVKDICNEYAMYFDPTSSLSISNEVLNYYENNKINGYNLDYASSHASNFSASSERTLQYINILIGNKQ